MEIEVIVGIVSVGVAVLASVLAYFWLSAASSTPHVRQNTVLMTFAGWIMLGSLVPQLLKNHELGPRMHDSVSPFFPALYPLVMFARFPAESELIATAWKNDRHYEMSVLVFPQYFMVIGFVVWIFQYAVTAENQTVEGILYGVGVVYSLGIIAISSRIYDILQSEGSGSPRVFSVKPRESNDDNSDDEGSNLLPHPEPPQETEKAVSDYI